jgi:hypothetical protein
MGNCIGGATAAEPKARLRAIASCDTDYKESEQEKMTILDRMRVLQEEIDDIAARECATDLQTKIVRQELEQKHVEYQLLNKRCDAYQQRCTNAMSIKHRLLNTWMHQNTKARQLSIMKMAGAVSAPVTELEKANDTIADSMQTLEEVEAELKGEGVHADVAELQEQAKKLAAASMEEGQKKREMEMSTRVAQLPPPAYGRSMFSSSHAYGLIQPSAPA